MTDLSDLTTLRLGGPARRLVDATSEAELVEAVRAPDPVLLLAGGSNVVVADAGFDGTVVRVASRGRTREGGTVTVQAGEDWDAFVAACVADSLSGVEALSGIPGSVGATPIQNVGAYGQEVADTITAVRALERATGTIHDLTPADCGFGYRDSRFKRDPGAWVVLAVTFALEDSPLSAPVRYAELARTLDVAVGDRAPLAEVREAVLGLRRGKGMVLDAADPDTRSAGSFFTNPVVAPTALDGIEGSPPAWPQDDGTVKTSAAWLIERAGFHKGYGNPDGIAISSKHTLALTNRGAGTTAELVTLAREIASGVQATFGIALHPEPVFVGHDWS